MDLESLLGLFFMVRGWHAPSSSISRWTPGEERGEGEEEEEVAVAAATFEFESLSAMATIELKLSRTNRVYRPSVSPLFSICQLITNKGDN